MLFQPPELYPIIDVDFLRSRNKSLEGELQILRRYPVNIVQIRWKTGSTREFYKVVKKIRNMWDKKLIVNDRVDLALAVEADGVHLGKDDIPLRVARELLGERKIIGFSSHSIEEVRTVNKEPIDYVAFGSIFPTSTKGRKVEVQGVEKLRMAVKNSHYPLVAIGGINYRNIKTVLETGVDGIAMIAGIFEGDTDKNLKLIFEEIEKWKNFC